MWPPFAVHDSSLVVRPLGAILVILVGITIGMLIYRLHGILAGERRAHLLAEYETAVRCHTQLEALCIQASLVAGDSRLARQLEGHFNLVLGEVLTDIAHITGDEKPLVAMAVELYTVGEVNTLMNTCQEIAREKKNAIAGVSC